MITDDQSPDAAIYRLLIHKAYHTTIRNPVCLRATHTELQSSLSPIFVCCNNFPGWGEYIEEEPSRYNQVEFAAPGSMVDAKY